MTTITAYAISLTLNLAAAMCRCDLERVRICPQCNLIPGVNAEAFSGALQYHPLHRRSPGTTRPGYKLPLSIQGRPHDGKAERTAMNRTYFTSQRFLWENALYVVKERNC